MKNKLLSVIVPVYNEKAGILRFVKEELLPELDALECKAEVILVDDGSCDGTAEILAELADGEKVKLVTLSRNFGKEMAVSAGLKYAVGDAAIVMDADGQHPAKYISVFVTKWADGADVVVGIRKGYKRPGLVKSAGSKAYYKMANKLGDDKIMEGATDFRLISREVIDEYNTFTEHNRVARGLIDWMGFTRDYVYFTPAERKAGKPSYNNKKLTQLALDSFVSMSTKPLKIFGYLGLFITMLSFGLGVFCLVQQHILGDPLGLRWNGALEMAILIAFLVGLLMISQSVTALYISHIFTEAKGRPLYVVDKKKSKV